MNTIWQIIEQKAGIPFRLFCVLITVCGIGNSMLVNAQQVIAGTVPKSQDITPAEAWQHLVDAQLSHWDIFMGIPHKQSGIAGYEQVEDVRFGKPIGLNKDPKHVFNVIDEAGEAVIHITGEVFAGLVTKQNYQNYHFSAQFKWGDKKWPPRLNKKRNSGVLYHSVGNYDDFWNVWMSSLEFEVQEGDTGDFITISEEHVKAFSPCVKNTKKGKYFYSEHAELIELAWAKGFVTGRCWKQGDQEKPHGQWNTIELLTYNGTSLHIVNGVVVMRVEQPKYFNGEQWQPMHSGKIQLQSEAAEIFYKNIKIRPISGLPKR